MARAQFEYDEVGNTFYYVLVSFFAMLLLPFTYYIWPSLPRRSDVHVVGCQCEGDLLKRRKKDAIQPWERRKRIVKAVVLLILWALFMTLVYKVSQIEHEFQEYDPYKILGLDADADVSEIKKKYRELSKLHHPDRGGDAITFDNIVKAYKALTDEESRENWRLYGNPDGPKATTFGIALPKWIVSEQYGIWVLAFYGLLFMIILPTAVGFWWYNTMRYSADKVLLETTRLYYYFLQKTPSMEINRIIMVVAGSFEFWKKFNVRIVERESDDVDVPRAMKEVRNLGENKRENPFCHPWSVKARTLLHCYLTRVDTLTEKLQEDQAYLIGRILPLLEEYIRVLVQMIIQIPMQRTPTLDTLENSLRLFPMFVQAMWPRNSNLLQLPHFTEHNVHFLRKNRVYTCRDMARLGELKRRSLLNAFSDDQYKDIVYVLSMMPLLEVVAKIEVQGEDDKETVTLKRTPLLSLEKREEEIRNGPAALSTKQQQLAAEQSNDEGELIDGEEDGLLAASSAAAGKRKVWEKRPKKKLGKKGKGSGKPQQPAKKPALPPANTETSPGSPTSKQTAENSQPVPKKTPKEEKRKKEKTGESGSEDNEAGRASDGSDEQEGNSSDEENGSESEADGYAAKQEGLEDSSNNDEDNDEEVWGDAEGLVKKETLMDREPTNHHEVHCPNYPGDKYEWWYVYLVEKKQRRLISSVVSCKTLDSEKTVELKLSAPPQKGFYTFTVHVRSDSYMDNDYSQDLKMEVQPAREPIQVKYEDTEEENEDKEHFSGSSSDGAYTEGSDSEEEGEED